MIPLPPFGKPERAFTLIELIAAMGVLVILVLGVTLLLNGTVTATTLSFRHMDADGQARLVFDRMAVDFEQIVRRPDVDYILKDGTNTQVGNDQLAFFSQVPGYYPTQNPAPTAAYKQQCPTSLVAYRINRDTANTLNYNKLQRYGGGLLWSGVQSPTNSVAAMVFSAAPSSSAPNTISQYWPEAASASQASKYYDLASAQVFRFEYAYLLRGQTDSTGQSYPSIVSLVPWDTRVQHSTVTGLRDVAAFIVTIAMTDPRGRLLTTDAQLATVAAGMEDEAASLQPGDLEAQWLATVIAPASGLPRPTAAGIHVYRRYFYLPQNPTPSSLF